MFDVSAAPPDDGPRLLLTGRPGRWDWDTASWAPAPGDLLSGLTVRAWRHPRGGWRDPAVVYDRPGRAPLARTREITAVLTPVRTPLLRRQAQLRLAGLPDPPLHTWCSWVAEALGTAAPEPFGVAASDCTGVIRQGYVGTEALGRWLERMTDRFRLAAGWPRDPGPPGGPPRHG